MFDLGLLLKQLRQSKGYTQSQLAQKINKSKSTISRYENNIKIPSPDTIIDLAVLYNVSLDYLVGIDKKESIVIEDLTEDQKKIIKNILEEFREKRSGSFEGLTKRQQEILSQLMIQFQHQL